MRNHQVIERRSVVGKAKWMTRICLVLLNVVEILRPEWPTAIRLDMLRVLHLSILKEIVSLH